MVLQTNLFEHLFVSVYIDTYLFLFSKYLSV